MADSEQSPRGVFPLLFLKSHNATGSAMFIAIGRDEVRERDRETERDK